MNRHIYVIALDEFTESLFQTIRNVRDYEFHPLLSVNKVVAAHQYAMAELIEEARTVFRQADRPADAVVSYWDFPATLMLPILREAAGLPTSSTESILRCVHKFWSRRIQQEVVPDLVPPFAAFDPFAEDPLAQIEIDYPFWIKPIKAHSSILGFRIENADDFHAAIPEIRQRIGRFSEAFDYIFQGADVPEEIAGVGGTWCIAEELIAAPDQCTLEGYVFEGEPVVYGIVDSLREEGQSSFSRYHYPSRLPEALKQRMIEATGAVMRRTGIDNEPFNIEFFHDPETERLSLLEINPRISKSHCPLFVLVEGASHQEVMVEVALGRRPDYPRGEGSYPMATKFMIRRYTGDARVCRVPNREEIETMRQQVPGTSLKVWVEEGDRLSDFADQDSYSFEYANLFVGGESEEELQEKYRRAMDLLPFEFEPLRQEEC